MAVATAWILSAAALGLIFAVFQTYKVSRVSIKVAADETAPLTEKSQSEQNEKVLMVYEAISTGANAFLRQAYTYMIVFIVLFGLVVFLLVGSATNCGSDGKSSCWKDGGFSAISFAVGGLTSMASGFIGMRVATYANARTTVSCQRSWTAGFNTAFRAGSVMGFCLCSLALLVLYILLNLFKDEYAFDNFNKSQLFEVVAGYGLGGSSIALFGRVGGGIYTKAADVGADLVGKNELGLNEDDVRNPATIADNVGDNVGDVAGMGADLFGSFAEATCAALVLASSILPAGSTTDLVNGNTDFDWTACMFPLLISAGGIIVCFITTFFATDIPGLLVTAERHIERNLKIQLVVSTLLMTPMLYLLATSTLPKEFYIHRGNLGALKSGSLEAFGCAASGLWAGLIIGYFTEYMTSYSYSPVRQVSRASAKGHAINIIFGLALGYQSTIVPAIALAGSIYAAFALAHLYGVALAALGMLSTLAIGLTIDAYGPVTDCAGGVAEMAGMDEVRIKTDALDAAGNTTAAIGKGFAIGSAALVSLALFGAFVTRVGLHNVDMLHPLVFALLLVGAMLPYAFSAMTVKSVGEAAEAMVEEVRRQLREDPGILEGTSTPQYERCVAISTKASLREMMAPGAMVLLSPILVGFFFGTHAVTGLLAGGLVSGFQMAISMSNSGGAWDNAKKFLEQQGEKGSESHKAAVTGDTVGDPLKDTSGPSLNILMKLMAIVSVVFANFFTSHALTQDVTK